MKKLLLSLVVGLSFAACAGETTNTDTANERRFVSLDVCADQYALALLGDTMLAAVSVDASAGYSFMRDQAIGVPTVTAARAENILALSPTTIIRSYGGSGSEGFWQRLGIDVVQIGFASNLNDAAGALLQAADALDATAAAEDLLSAAPANQPVNGAGLTALYLTPGGVTAGPGTMIDDIFRRAGLSNYQQKAGWQALPLERLAFTSPDIIVTAFDNGEHPLLSPWSASRHPVALRQLKKRPVISLDSSWVSCGGWYADNAVKFLQNTIKKEFTQ